MSATTFERQDGEEDDFIEFLILGGFGLGCGLIIEAFTSMELRDGEYGAAFSHCYSHCLQIRWCGPLAQATSIIIGYLTEIAQAACVSFSLSARRSAMQQSDYWDNELGRRLGMEKGDCFELCKKAMGGKTKYAEGGEVGSSRPYGPYHATNPGPEPTWGDVLGGTMPGGWGK